MHEETMKEIQRASQERLSLHMLAGHSRLTTEQVRRLNELDGLMPELWDRYRREYSARGSEVARFPTLRQAA